MKVTSENYQEFAKRTVANSYSDIITRIYNLGVPTPMLETLLFVTTKLDQDKKALFYGKNVDMSTLEKFDTPIEEIDTKSIDFLHGVIGLATEAGEMAQAFLEKKKDHFDKANILEEVGDVLWYLALILNSIDCTLDQAMQVNIEKLAKRYPDGFSDFNAVNRQLGEERTILENGVQEG